MPPTLLSPRELADKLDASYEDVLSWTRRGLIPSIKSSGRYYYNFPKVVKALHGGSAEKTRTAEAATCI